jgi:hypothetical protein
MGSENKSIKMIKSQLNQIEEKQLQNQIELAKLDQTEEKFFETNQSGKLLFDSLFHTWKKDQEILSQLEQEQTRLQFYQRKVQDELESKRNYLIKENRRLVNLEDDLYKKLL